MLTAITRLYLLLTIFLLASAHDIVNNHEIVVFYDDFKNNDNNWVLDTRYSTGSIQDGYFKLISGGERSDIRIQTLDRVKEVNDFKVEAKIKIIGDSPYSNAIVWGTNTVGGHFEEGLSFGINSNQEFIVLNTQNWVAESVIKWELSDKILADDYNIIQLRKKGDEYHFYINNQLVKTLPSELFIGQNFGFHAANDATIHVDYFKVSIYVPIAN